MASNDKTLVIIKPDAVKKGIVGNIITTYEQSGLVIEAMKMLMATPEMLEEHYREHVSKAFYPKLCQFMLSGRLVVLVLGGDHAVETVRHINGATNPKEASKASIRGMYATDTTHNCVHGSDSYENALREMRIWFGESCIIE